MSRRRRKTPRRRTNRWLVLVQLVGLAAILAFILLFRDFIAESTSQVVGALGAEDIRVEKDRDEANQQEANEPDRGDERDDTDSDSE